ncbi:MAG: hypothetical protein QG670_2696 [Thermoproteota archaeon]|nr:hypothetical protein [Thermoproteota archaeon]
MDLTSTLFQTLVASGVMFIISIAIMLIVSFPGVKSDQPAGDKNEPYLGGEKQPFSEESIDSNNLFLSIVNQSLRKVYVNIIDRLNTYSMGEWMFGMSLWLTFLIVFLLTVVVIL